MSFCSLLLSTGRTVTRNKTAIPHRAAFDRTHGAPRRRAPSWQQVEDPPEAVRCFVLEGAPRLPVSNLPATSGTSKSEIVSVLKNCEENPLRVGCPIWCLTTVPISVSFLAIAIHFGRTGDQLFMIEEGSVDSETMFSIAHQKNTFRTWMIRLFGCLLTFIGFWIILFEVFLECGIH